MSKKRRNIIHDDIKREKRGSFIKIFLIFIILPVIIFTGYYFISQKVEETIIEREYIDNRFEMFTTKNIIDFEKPTTDLIYYNKDKNFYGYFYKEDKISVDKLNDSVKIISTIDRMFNCVKLNDGKDACGIKAINYGYQVPTTEVLKYAKLMYGDNLELKHQSVEFPYGSINNLKLTQNYYTFNQAKDDINNVINNYISILDSIKEENKQIILTKYVIFVESEKINGKLNGYAAYTNREKTTVLFTNHSKNFNMNEMILDIEKQIKNIEAPKYKVFFDKQRDGSLTFRQIELVK